MIATLGIDEAGRGSWAGPLVVASVILNKKISGLTDSKKLSKVAREKLAAKIYDNAVAIGVGLSESSQIDELGLTEAERIAIEASLVDINEPYDEIIIDGKYNFLPYNPKARAVVKADGFVDSVSAASIIAKVVRDKIMEDHAQQYPEYGFDMHVGYGTALHKSSLEKHGTTEIHRMSYKPIKAIVLLRKTS
jgi:ribonuclease HII